MENSMDYDYEKEVNKCKQMLEKDDMPLWQVIENIKMANCKNKLNKS